MDGRHVAALDLTTSLRAKSLQNGPVRSERPGVVLLFFDQNRKPIGTAHLAPPIADEPAAVIEDREPEQSAKAA